MVEKRELKGNKKRENERAVQTINGTKLDDTIVR